MKGTTLVIAMLATSIGAQQPSRLVTIQGRTIDAITREPVRGAAVHVNFDTLSDSRLPPEVEFLTGIDGRFVLRDLPPGTFRLFATKTGYLNAASAELSIGSSGLKDGVEIVLTPAATIDGTIRDQAGEPLTRATVRATPRGETPGMTNLSATADDTGRYSIGGLAAGDYVITAQTPSIAPGLLYYPSVSSLEDAVPLSVKAGDERTAIDFVVPTGVRDRANARPEAASRTPTGRVSGVVRDADGRGFANVTVGLMSIESDAARGTTTGRAVTTMTDSTGAFLFDTVGPGEYRVTTIRPGPFTGTEEVLGGGMIVLAAGQSIPNLVVTLQRLATISGTIRDQYGDPVSATFTVSTAASGYAVTSGNTTDSRGRFSVGGLRPGQYLLSTDRTSIGKNLRTFDDSGQERNVAYQVTYYPGVSDVATATPIAIDGRDVSGLELIVRPQPATTVDVVVDPMGRSVSNVEVHAIAAETRAGFGRQFRTSVPNDSLRVVVNGVTSGKYWVVASGDELDAEGRRSKRFWARQEVLTDGFAPQTVRLQLEPSATFSGRIVFEGVSAPPATAMVNLRPLPPGDLQTTFSNQAAKGRGGMTFAVDDVKPGRYLVDASDNSNPQTPWILKSVISGGRELFDLPIELSAGGGLDDVVMTFIDRASATEIAGTLTDAAGRPLSDVAVLIFSTDSRYWRDATRHARFAVPDARGRYLVAGLPAGDYFAAATPPRFVDLGLPATLSKLAPTAVRFTLHDGEHKVVDVRQAR
jgi:hypothetical protein